MGKVVCEDLVKPAVGDLEAIFGLCLKASHTSSDSWSLRRCCEPLVYINP